MREVQIPLPGAPWPILKASMPFTREAWDRFLKTLVFMEDAFVEPKKDEPKNAEGSAPKES